jgi:hypothetical protein
MRYRKLKPHLLDAGVVEEEMRRLWHINYCNSEVRIITFDGILVSFYDDMFDHVFFESYNFKARDKSILSLNRLEKMLWIKDTLEDEDSILKQGWLRDKKKYDGTRRVSVVKGNYVVIISINKQGTKARFITAYEINEEDNLEKIMSSPDWN